MAPVQEGQQVAELTIKNKDQIIKTLPLYARKFKKVNFFKSLVTSINYLNRVMFKQKPFFIVFEGVEDAENHSNQENYSIN